MQGSLRRQGRREGREVGRKEEVVDEVEENGTLKVCIEKQ